MHLAHLCACSECAGHGTARIRNLSASWLIGTARIGSVSPIFSVPAHSLNEGMDTPRGDGCLKPLAAHSPWQLLFQTLPAHPAGAAAAVHWGWPFPCQSQEQFPGPAWLGFTLQGWIQLGGTCFPPSEVPSAAASPTQPESLLCFQF